MDFPNEFKSCATVCFSCLLMPDDAFQTEIPSKTCAGKFGITRTIFLWFLSNWLGVLSGTPAAMGIII